ncbi:MAG: hypothetical protein KJN80_01720, partial [Deltaproteobacteria bacterium]|nr:hypothetical protein [Deltaproteobacteria bacterium]
MEDLREMLKISTSRLDMINQFLSDPGNEAVNAIMELVDKYGGPDEINRKAAEAQKPETLLNQLKEMNSPYVNDLKWLGERIADKSFISMDQYREKILGEKLRNVSINEEMAVTLEISAYQYFPWLISQAKRAIEKKELMPGRFIRVRNMAEQIEDQGDTLAVAAAMQMIGASYVETLDTKGLDGSNIHLGGVETVTGYFGGIGQPNDHPVKWLDEYLKYYTTYGIRQVL